MKSTAATLAFLASAVAATPLNKFLAPRASSGTTYVKTFTGNGEVADGWPNQSEWLSFNVMWNNNLADILSISCSAFSQPNNSPAENNDIMSAIQSIAGTTGVDERYILAIVLQESNGCVRVPETNFGVANPGM